MGKDVPLKWRKYRLLVRLDLLSDSEIQGIRRFQTIDQSSIQQYLDDEVGQLLGLGERLVVIKIVGKNRVGQLPNCRLASVEDIPLAVAFLGKAAPGDEVWFCQTSMTHSALSVAGRLSFSQDWPRFQILEMVWRASPRLIESVNADSDLGFVSGSRIGWGRRFNMERVIEPKDRSTATASLSAAFNLIALFFERRQRRIEVLTAIFERLKIQSYSLEYKYTAGAFEIIDWDTDNDRRVLNDRFVRLLSGI